MFIGGLEGLPNVLDFYLWALVNIQIIWGFVILKAEWKKESNLNG